MKLNEPGEVQTGCGVTNGGRDVTEDGLVQHILSVFGYLRLALFRFPPLSAYARCELACKAHNHRYYARFQRTVEDGTRCKHDVDAICLAGECLVSWCECSHACPQRERGVCPSATVCAFVVRQNVVSSFAVVFFLFARIFCLFVSLFRFVCFGGVTVGRLFGFKVGRLIFAIFFSSSETVHGVNSLYSRTGNVIYAVCLTLVDHIPL